MFGFEEGLLGVGFGVGAGVGVGTGVVFAVTEIVFEDDMSVFLPSWVVTSPDTLIFILPVPLLLQVILKQVKELIHQQ